VSVSDRVRDIVAPICTDLGLELYDVEHTGGKVRVTVERPGGVDLEALSIATRLISRELDERDPVPGRYQLEVSSPGLERSLRLPAHFQRAVGSTVSIRLHPGAGDERRLAGTLTDADDEGITVQLEGTGAVQVPYGDIERARTTFAWGGQPKPGKRPAAQHSPARRESAKEQA
jgi:ribosome maturation factor RimP